MATFKAVPKKKTELTFESAITGEDMFLTITLIPSIPWEGEYCEGGVVQLRASRMELNMSIEKFNQYFEEEKKNEE